LRRQIAVIGTIERPAIHWRVQVARRYGCTHDAARRCTVGSDSGTRRQNAGRHRTVVCRSDHASHARGDAQSPVGAPRSPLSKASWHDCASAPFACSPWCPPQKRAMRHSNASLTAINRQMTARNY